MKKKLMIVLGIIIAVVIIGFGVVKFYVEPNLNFIVNDFLNDEDTEDNSQMVNLDMEDLLNDLDKDIEKSNSPSTLILCISSASIICCNKLYTSLLVRTTSSNFTNLPLTLAIGNKSTVICTSDAFKLTALSSIVNKSINFSSLFIYILWINFIYIIAKN